ncbi:MAG: SGNH/GDSL hydrolase family protein [Candidatus Aminicenantes bacterium]|nr:SGNH/GDSL hydrolase family protein [Candidatus Aminicenantes bacterium]
MKPILRPLLLLILHCLAACCRRDPIIPIQTGYPVILCAGDSITAADYPGYLQELMDKNGLLVQVINAGRKGDSTAEYIRFLEKSRIVERINPSWVLLQLGTNDLRIDSHATTTEQFKKNIESILDRIERHRLPDGSIAQIILATIPPIPLEVRWHFDASSRLRVEAEINPTLRDIARRRGLILADNHALFVNRPDLLPEIHPSKKGYRALAAAWHRILAPLVLSAATRKHKAQ